MRIDSVATELKLAGQLQLQDILSLHSPLIQVAAVPATIIGFEIFFFFGPVHVPMALLSGTVKSVDIFLIQKATQLLKQIALEKRHNTFPTMSDLYMIWSPKQMDQSLIYRYRYWAILPFRIFFPPPGHQTGPILIMMITSLLSVSGFFLPGRDW